jgi:hypothetical protein
VSHERHEDNHLPGNGPGGPTKRVSQTLSKVTSGVKWLAPENLVLVVVVAIGLRLSSGHGILGFVALISVCAVLGGVMGLVGRRFPMIYRQNRRHRRRRSDAPTIDDKTRAP